MLEAEYGGYKEVLNGMKISGMVCSMDSWKGNTLLSVNGLRRTEAQSEILC